MQKIHKNYVNNKNHIVYINKTNFKKLPTYLEYKCYGKT